MEGVALEYYPDDQIVGNEPVIKDRCAKQYKCVTAFNVLSMLAVKYNIVIDSAIGAPVHVKDVADGLNAVDERYLEKCMFMLLNPEKKMCENK
eukprot:13183341-Ditylum_brightwellii.AAC.1